MTPRETSDMARQRQEEARERAQAGMALNTRMAGRGESARSQAEVREEFQRMQREYSEYGSELPDYG
jgi:hypothetical protein